MLSKIENIEMKKIRSFVLFVIFIGFLISSSVMFNGCQPEETDIKGNDNICDTCNKTLQPNYINPPEKNQLFANLDFPKRKKIVESISGYGN